MTPSRRDLLRTAAIVGAAASVPSVLGRTTAANASTPPTATPLAIAPRTALTATVASTKTAPTFYTAERVDAARRNIDAYDWARTVRDAAIDTAKPLLDKGDEWLWHAIPGQTLPRSYAVNQDLGSPITGRDIYKFGNYPWLADPFTSPWKMTDPSSGYVFPTNDFGAYYASGLDAHGIFDRTKADRSLLVNLLHPERGPTWGVDDGFGWVDENNNKWTFIAYYVHWYLWYLPAVAPTKAVVYNGVRACRDAYVYTGDLKYARAGLILLDRIADVYPSMTTSAYKREDGYLASDGLSGKGRILGCIWETGPVRDYCSAYDAFFPAIATADDANVVPLLSSMATKYGLPAKNSIEDIKANIENRLVREVFPAVKGHQIAGNFGMHQGALAMAGVVLDAGQESRDMIDWVFKSGGRVTTPDYALTGGNMYATLAGDVDRDGFGNEAAPGYNFGWISNIQATADALADYKSYPTANLYEHPKYAKMIGARSSLTMLNRYTPPIGDSGATGMPGLFGTAQQYTLDYERYGSTEAAQVAYQLNGNSVSGLYSSIFATDVEKTRDRISSVIDEKGTLRQPSVSLTGHGFAALRAGKGDSMRGAWLYYGRNSGHGHLDALNLGLHAFRTDLAPDLGYPEFADNNARRIEWNANTIAHNTVTVDAKGQGKHWVGTPHGFASTDRVQMLDISAPKVYTQTSVYRRMTALIRIDDANSYAVDVFRVFGGTDHHFSFHGAEGPVTTSGLTLTPQATGSYPGPDILPPADNAKPRAGASGFDWLSNVSRDLSPDKGFAVDWKVKDTWNVNDPDLDLHLRMQMVTTVDDVALCDGSPPRNKPGNPGPLRYLIAHRRGTALKSQFVSIFEPYVGKRTIASAESVKIQIVTGTAAPHEFYAAKVTLANGRVDYIVSSIRPDVLLKVDDKFLFRGAFGVWSLVNGQPVFGFGHDAQMVGPLPQLEGLPALTGTVTAFTRELTAQNSVTIRLAQKALTPKTLIGTYVYIANDGERNAVYQVRAVSLVDASTVRLDIGDTTTIRGYVDVDDFSKGFRYDLAVGAAARIPLTREWSA